MRGTEFPIAFSFEFDGFALSLGTGTATSSTTTSEPGVKNVEELTPEAFTSHLTVEEAAASLVQEIEADTFGSASTLEQAQLKQTAQIWGDEIGSSLSVGADAEVIQKCQIEPPVFQYPNPPGPPKPWWPQDFFIYQAPEPLQGLDRPLIGEIWGEPPWVLRAITGEGSQMIEPQMQKLPFQLGETFLNSSVMPRVIAMTIRIIGQETTVGDEIVNPRRNLFFLRNLLAQALVVQPLDRPAPGERPKLGRLFYFRQDYPVFGLEVIARDSPQFMDIEGTDRAVDADIEFVAPEPYWNDHSIPATRGRQDRQCWFYPAGGMEFSMTFSTEFSGQIYERELFNRGDVRTPILFEQRGPLNSQGLTLSNDTTGEQLVVAGPLQSNETLIINTAFGRKTVKIRNQDTGAETDALSRLDFEQSSFWQLQRGSNQVTLTTNGAEPTSIARVRWFNRYAGV